MDVEQETLGQALVRLRDEPASLDVVVTEAHLVSPVVDAAARLSGSQASVAQAWLPDHGPASSPRSIRVRTTSPGLASSTR